MDYSWTLNENIIGIQCLIILFWGPMGSPSPQVATWTSSRTKHPARPAARWTKPPPSPAHLSAPGRPRQIGHSPKHQVRHCHWPESGDVLGTWGRAPQALDHLRALENRSLKNQTVINHSSNIHQISRWLKVCSGCSTHGVANPWNPTANYPCRPSDSVPSALTNKASQSAPSCQNFLICFSNPSGATGAESQLKNGLNPKFWAAYNVDVHLAPKLEVHLEMIQDFAGSHNLSVMFFHVQTHPFLRCSWGASEPKL